MLFYLALALIVGVLILIDNTLVKHSQGGLSFFAVFIVGLLGALFGTITFSEFGPDVTTTVVAAPYSDTVTVGNGLVNGTQSYVVKDSQGNLVSFPSDAVIEQCGVCQVQYQYGQKHGLSNSWWVLPFGGTTTSWPVINKVLVPDTFTLAPLGR